MRPPVSIGIPTYNRDQLIERAIESVVNQSWSDLELVISDNASTDRTESICRQWAARDPRIRYLRQERNLGPTSNFNLLFDDCSRSEFAMVLSDDDWLDADYVERCRAVLVQRPDHAIIAGTPRYVRGADFVYEGPALQMQQDDPSERVAAYYAAVVDNGTFYGLIRGAALRAATPMPNVVANDWLVVGRVVFQGKLMTLRDTHVNRELGGTSASVASTARMIGASELEARIPHFYNAFRVLRDIVTASPVFRALPARQRLVLGTRAAVGVVDWRSLAWHLTAPTAQALGRRSRAHWVWRWYDALTRALGAGRQPW